MTTWPAIAFAGDGGVSTTTISSKLIAAVPTGAVSVFLFISPEFDGETIVAALSRARPEAQIFGASASGVLGPGAIYAGGVSLLCIPCDALTVVPICFVEPVNEAGWQAIGEEVAAAAEGLGLDNLPDPGGEGLVILFSAGLLGSEERVTARLHLLLPDLPLVGGTASDGLRFKETFVINDGRVCKASNLALLCRSRRPFHGFHHHHFRPSAEDLVVTALGDSPRQVLEFNGRPAREELARALKMPAAAMTVPNISKFPLGVSIHDRWYIRSVMQVGDPDLLFACALELGAVLSVMQAGNILGELDELLSRRSQICGGILFNCLGRFFELQEERLLDDAAQRWRDLAVAGMNSYGEQYMGLHLNHTLTGVLFFQ